MSTLHPLILDSENLALWEQQEFLSNALLKRDKEIKRLRETIDAVGQEASDAKDHRNWEEDDPFIAGCLEVIVAKAREALEKNP